MTKKLLAILCVAVLVVAGVFVGVLIISKASKSDNLKTFVFEWSSSEQNVVDNTLRMKLTFSWNQETDLLSIITEINDNEYNGHDYVGLVFDINGDGTLETKNGLILFSRNYTISGFLSSDGFLKCGLEVPIPSWFHTCVFQQDVGYTFNISLPISELREYDTPSDLIHLCFYDEDCHCGVYECFHFGIQLSIEED